MTQLTASELELELTKDITRFVHDPLNFCKFIFPWGSGELSDVQGPRVWQADVLGDIGDHLMNPETRHSPFLLSVASGKGIGKSALVGMIISWGMSTCEDCKIVLTANTDTQLKTKTWPEVCKWMSLALNEHWWKVEAESITYDGPKKRVWRCDRIAWSERNTEAFAGLHNKGKRLILIFDEASAIPEDIWKVAEGALTDEDTEITWIAFGNPTRPDGRFFECFGKRKHRWNGRQIDSRNVEGTNKEELAQQVKDEGEDSDFVRIWVKGMFPRKGSTQLIPSDLVEAARKHKAVSYSHLPKILCCDVARFGDDQTIIGTRQGRKTEIKEKHRGLDVIQVSERVIALMKKEKPGATVIDGDGLGAGVVDYIRARGFKVFEFHGGARAMDPEKYFNRRSECWGLILDYLRDGADIPDDQELASDLTGPNYLYSMKGQIQLEKKEDMKRRGLNSPDCGDFLAMTFGVTLAQPPKMKAPVRQPVSAWN